MADDGRLFEDVDTYINSLFAVEDGVLSRAIERTKAQSPDDNAPVIDSSRNYGVAYNLIVARPDSQKPVKTNLSYPSFDHYEKVCPQIKANR